MKTIHKPLLPEKTEDHYNSSKSELYNILQGTSLIGMPLLIQHSSVNTLLIVISIIAMSLECIYYKKNMEALKDHLIRKKTIVHTLYFIEGMTTCTYLIKSFMNHSSLICYGLFWASAALLIALSLYHVCTIAYTLYHSNAPDYQKHTKKIASHSLQLLSNGFYLFATFSGLITMNAFTMGIVTAVSATIIIIIFLIKYYQERHTTKELTQTINPSIQATVDPIAPPHIDPPSRQEAPSFSA